MSVGYFYDAGGYLDYDKAAALLPVDELEGTVHTHRDAERVFQDVAAEAVIAVRPTGLATSYALTQRPVAAIEVTSLGDDCKDQLENTTALDVQAFDYIQVGRSTSPAPNRSLTEF